MRDRLIEIIDDSLCGWLKSGEAESRIEEYVADYLLANGIIVIPCKVGDTVYQVNLTYDDTIEELEILNISLHKNKPYYETETVDFDADAIGAVIFLTREEAEQAKKNRKQFVYISK